MYEYVHAQILPPLQKSSQWWEMKVSPLTPTVQSSCVHCGYADHLFLKRKIKGTLKNFWSKDYPKIIIQSVAYPLLFISYRKVYLQFYLKIFFSMYVYYQKTFRHCECSEKLSWQWQTIEVKTIHVCSSIQPLCSCSC